MLRKSLVLPTFLVAAMAFAAPLSAQSEPSASPTAAAETTPAVDPEVDTDTLAIQLDPLTRDEIQSTMERWFEQLRITSGKVAAAEIAVRQGSGNRTELTQLRDQRDQLLKRFDVILKAYEVKGGDPSQEKAYAAAVAGIKSDPKDIGSFLHDTQEWLRSKDGGIHWLFAALQFIGIMVVFWFLAALIARLTERALEKGSHLSGLLRTFIKTWIRRVVVIVGLIVALGTVGVNVGAALALIGGGAFILGFALQDTLGNLANGLMLLINRPFDVGDAVEVGGVSGSVVSVSLVNTTIRTWDNKKVLVPNKSVWGQTITNITGMPTRRVDMVFGIGYDDDTDLAEEILRRLVTQHELTLEDPAPQVELHELADSSINFICRPWAKTSDYWRVHWDITKAVKKEFDAAGISIPFPQRDVHVYHENAARLDSSESSEKPA
ncbi:small conductance mechanosensitive channel [Haloferula luteola]|uniref:Small conductance mechanosensitive channel n=1 Tax=Haloferula luteola TaxID=595692 RepID=A0A840V7G9_9BACT|nr:mechanosensitive ion channel family protein [Haloferula luteola]MBB5352986.1 small conductance mechanosensitive channel [Haloferula luteola]